MPHKKNVLHPETLAIHAGTHSTGGSKSVIPAIEVSTIFEHSPAGWQAGDLMYTRHQNPNRTQLEELLAALEGGAEAIAFASGVAALGAVFQAVEPGAHILIPADVYAGTRKLLQEFGQRWNLLVEETDMQFPEKIEAALRPNTKLILVETPSNPMLVITNLREIAALCKKHSIILAVDNTWPTPIITRPLILGADVVIHSTTKYLGGHSDLIGGAVVSARAGSFHERIRMIQIAQGAIPSARDCWLLCRSIRTLPHRMKAHNFNAMEMAKLLESHPAVQQIFYPGLPSHVSHEVAASQMNGFGGMLSFLVNGDEKKTLRVVSGTQLIRRATSLGGVESTWEHRKSSEGELSKSPPNLIRFSVGLEHIDDLKTDVIEALNKI